MMAISAALLYKNLENLYKYGWRRETHLFFLIPFSPSRDVGSYFLFTNGALVTESR